MWVRGKKGKLFNLDCAFDVFANDPRSEVAGRVFGCWTVVARTSQNVGVIANCESQEEADAICRAIWDGLTRGASHLDLVPNGGANGGAHPAPDMRAA